MQWRNWSRQHQGHFLRHDLPRSVDDIRETVLHASSKNRKLVATGAGFSYNEIASPDQCHWLDLSRFCGVLEVNEKKRSVTVLAGTSIKDINGHLKSHNLVLPAHPALDQQSIAGAISTCTHGSDHFASSLSEYVTEISLIAASGVRLNASISSNTKNLDAFKVSLGSLGIITHITLKCESLVFKKISCSLVSTDELTNNLSTFLRFRNFSAHWFPFRKQAIVKIPVSIDASRATSDKACPSKEVGCLSTESNYPSLHSVVEQKISNERLFDRAKNVKYISAAVNEAFLSYPRFRQFAIEYAVPIPKLSKVLNEIVENGLSDIIGAPVDLRFSGPESAWLSPSFGRSSVYIGVPLYALDDRSYCRRVFFQLHKIFLKYGGRPHWGKVHFLDHVMLLKTFPKFEEFCDLRLRMDPNGLFLNEYKRSLFGVK